jgi:DNA-binding NtrC family response regulator
MDPLQDEGSRLASSDPSAVETWLEEAISKDPVLGRIFPQLRRVAASDAPVLISGEPGSGVELAARAIHNLSHRAAHPFVVLDCSDFSEPLIEAELVGMNGGGGGAPRKMGVFEQAGEGSVHLAEVGELPPRGQEALLRLLDRHEIIRLDSKTPIPAHARCIASTSVDLRARIPAGLFREELHARLATEVLVLPPLRDRREDIPSLAQHFLQQCCAHLPQSAREMTREAEAALREYTWPANLRELREAVEEAAMRARGQRIGVEHLPERIRRPEERGPLPSLRDVEMRHIQRVLEEARGNQRRASRILGISRWSLSRRLRKYGMQPRPDQE